mmetsp:Transcript_9411/g.18652  ORF Transcript_9411/g.18652 Transcript_9411/m.18652 type:complete len:671 (-) Transcript_9411:460-2472(-)
MSSGDGSAGPPGSAPGLASSLLRFGKLYVAAWRREIEQLWAPTPQDAPGNPRDHADCAGGAAGRSSVPAGPDAGAGGSFDAQVKSLDAQHSFSKHSQNHCQNQNQEYHTNRQSHHQIRGGSAPGSDPCSQGRESCDCRGSGHSVANSEFAFSPRRAAALVACGVTVPALMVWNHVGFWFDSVFYGDYRHQEVERPTFIVGHARSGTNWAHRVLAEDDVHFTAPQLWEMVFAQSVSWRLLFFKIAAVDQKFGGFLKRLLKRVDHAAMKQTRGLGLSQREEDEWLMLNIAASQLASLLFPLNEDDQRNLNFFDSTLSTKQRHLIFAYYRQCIQRHLYAHELMEDIRFNERARLRERARSLSVRSKGSQRSLSGFMSPNSGSELTLRTFGSHQEPVFSNAQGSQRSMVGALPEEEAFSQQQVSNSRHLQRRRKVRYLAMNPTFTLRLKTLFETFPDANVVVMVRDPFRAIPSMISHNAMCVRYFATPTVRYPQQTSLANMSSLYYTYPVFVRNCDPRAARQMCFLHYELCADDLVKSFTALYAHLGLSMTSRMAASLMDEAKLSRQYAGTHHYNIVETTGKSLEEFISRHRAAFELYPAYLRGLEFDMPQHTRSPTSLSSGSLHSTTSTIGLEMHAEEVSDNSDIEDSSFSNQGPESDYISGDEPETPIGYGF